MPRPELPPTPASSTEIKGKDGPLYSSLQMSFELPPPAVSGTPSQRSSISSAKSSSASSYHPTSPKSPAIPSSEVVKIRRRSSVAHHAPNNDAFALPPPPTRSRKIIQMKPRGQADEVAEEASKNTAGKQAPSPNKKKQPSATSVAGRKIARKTAHSLIERRRRSKMNEEFGVLKDMIPACTGEMHKLAILQASIEYIRYLEDCVGKLKTENNLNHNQGTSTPTREQQFTLPPPSRRSYPSPTEQEDVEMSNASHSSSSHPSPTHSLPRQTLPSVSPALLPQDSSYYQQQQHNKNRQNSYSSVSTDHRHYSFSASPALGPGQYDYAAGGLGGGNAGGSTLTSPALGPQTSAVNDRDMDQEATAALLMLNSDRRGTGRGMSVRDLLST